MDQFFLKMRIARRHHFLRYGLIGLTTLCLVSCAGGPRAPGGIEFPKSRTTAKQAQLPTSTEVNAPKSNESVAASAEAPEKTADVGDPKGSLEAPKFAPKWRTGGYEPLVIDTPSRQPEVQWRNGRLSFAFERAPIAAVAEAVLRDGLGAFYTIDPAVQGDVTLRTARALKRDDVVAALDRALWLSGAALIQNSDGTFTITTTDKAPSLAPPARLAAARTRGGGVVIVPLQWTSAESMASIIEGFGRKTSVLKVDGQRQLLILQGDERSLDVLLETIDMFDVDWLESADFAFYELKWTDPDSLIEELRALMGGESGPIGKQVEFVSLPRLRGLVVITKRPERQQGIGEWIDRLDKPAKGSSGRRIFHRWVINQEATSIAQTINDLFGQGSFSQSSQRSSDQSAAGDASSDRNGNNQTSQGNNAGQSSNPDSKAGSPTRSSATGQTGDSNSGTAESGQGGQISSGASANQQGLRITADKASNALLIYATDDEFQQIDEVVGFLDLAADQVMIEATIAEVVLNDQLKYGVQWFLNTRDGGNVAFSSGRDSTAPSAFPGFSYRFVGTNARAVLNALSEVTDVTVVSTPQIMTLDNKTATLQVGDQVPVITQSAQGTTTADARVVNTVQYRDTGVLLTVTPRIGQGDTVQIDAAQEVSEVAATSSSGIDSPTIQQRRFQSTVSIRNGETVALGGLIRTRQSMGDTRVPLLGSAPIIGSLFRTRDRSVRRTELIVFLTPTIVRNSEDAMSVTDDLRTKMRRLKQNGLPN